MFTTTVSRRRAIRRAGRKGFEIMTAREPAPRKTRQPAPADYEGFIDGAFRDNATGTSSPPTAADLEPRQLLRYAAGKATEDERVGLEDFVKRSR
jgi:hypothetical protein